MNRREMKLLLEERFDRIALLETRIDTMEQLVDSYHAREQSIIDTLYAAQNSAAKLVEDARAEAEGIREQARREGEEQLSQARNAAETAMRQAEQRAQEMRISAKTESDRMLRDAEIIKREYEEMIASFNAMLEQNASELRQTAVRFAEYVRGRKVDASEVKLDGEAFYKSVGAMSDAQLPDPSGDPAALMKNIYHLQNRPLPDAQDSAAEESGGAVSEPEAGNIAEEELPKEPYSEQAWADERQQSESEPQAEFTPAFDTAFVPSNFEVRSSECAAPSGEAEHAFDEYFSEQIFSNIEQNGQKSPPEPYSEKAWAQGAFMSSHEPQAEGALAFDAFFAEQESAEESAADRSATIEGAAAPAEEPAADRSATIEGAAAPAEESAADRSATIEGAAAPAEEPVSYENVRIEETVTPTQTPVVVENTPSEEAPAPEPYSEKAWAQGAFMSSHEPQAEGALAFDAMFGEETEVEADERTNHSAYEPREWEPEREPDSNEIPTVSRYVQQSGEEEEVTLDALLDEIIRAGE